MKKLFVIFAMLMLTLCSSAEGSYWHAKYYAYRRYNTGWSPWSRWIPCDIYIFTGNGGLVVYGNGSGTQYDKYTQVYHGASNKFTEYYDRAGNYNAVIPCMDLNMIRCSIKLQANNKKKTCKVYIRHSKIEYVYKIL